MRAGTRRMRFFSLLVLPALFAGCAADDSIPDGYGQLEARVDADPVAPYHAYTLYVVEIATGKLVFDDSLAVDEIAMPIDSRFVAALPADRPLIVGVLATDADGVEVGAGSVVIELVPKQKTTIQIAVLAHAAGRAGTLDAQVTDAKLPSREVLAPAPATNKPGGTQTVFGQLTAIGGAPVTDVVAVDLDAAVAPMFLVEKGGVTTSFVWPTYAAYPASAAARLAFLDGAGRGWIGSATTKFAAADQPVVIDVAWSGQIHASGQLPNAGRWLMGPIEELDQTISPCGVAFFADGNGDGVFAGTERVRHAMAETGRAYFWTAPSPVALLMPPAVVVGGALVDTSGDGSFDTFLALDVGGQVHVTPWPIDPNKP